MRLKPLNFKVGAVIFSDELDTIVREIHNSLDDFYEGDLSERILGHSKYKLSVVPMDQVDLYAFDTYMEHVDTLEKLIADTKTYPPIILTKPDYNGVYEIIDGAHRSEALENLGQKSMFAWVPM
jgi:hypothetical protein